MTYEELKDAKVTEKGDLQTRMVKLPRSILTLNNILLLELVVSATGKPVIPILLIVCASKNPD